MDDEIEDLMDDNYDCDYDTAAYGDDEDEDDEENREDDDDDLEHENTTVSFDSLLDLSCERRLGVDVCVSVSPSTISVRKIDPSSSSDASSSQNDNDELLVECRIRYLSFMGISNDVR